jgi:hypothetical protein
MMTDGLQSYTEDQRQHLDAMVRLWPHYALAMRELDDLAGGMQWKAVSGRIYLMRYRQDPVTGKKVFRSMGPRSPETEKAYDDFTAERERTKAVVEQLRPRIEIMGRVAKAHRLGRVAARFTAPLRELWRLGLMTHSDSRIAVLGGTALSFYECLFGVFVPTSLHKDQRLDLMVRRGPVDEDLVHTAAACLGRSGRVRIAREGDRIARLERDDGLTMTLTSTAGIAEILDGQPDLSEETRETIIDAVNLPPTAGMVIGRDATIMAMVVLNPAAYALVSPYISRDHDEEERSLSTSRSMMIADLIHSSRTGFTPAHEAALDEILVRAPPMHGLRI